MSKRSVDEKRSRKRMTRAEWRNWLKWFLLAVAIIVVYKSFDRVSDIFKLLGSFWRILTPFIIAFVIAYFLDKPVQKLEKPLSGIKIKKIKGQNFFNKHYHGLSVTIVYLIFVGVLALLGVALIPELTKGITMLFANYKQYLDNANDIFVDLQNKYTFLADVEIGSQLIAWLKKTIESIDVTTVVGYLESIISLGGAFGNIAVGIFVSIYMLLEKDQLKAAVKRAAGVAMKTGTIDNIGYWLHKTDSVVFQYFVTQFFDCVIVSILATVALLIMGAPSPIVLGFIFGMFNIIPYFGPIIAGVAVVLVMLVSMGLTRAFWGAVVLLVLQQIDANIINPRILGDSLDMSPFWVIFAVTVGGGLFGFGGMLLSVPILAVIRMLYREFLLYRRTTAVEKDTADGD